MGFSMHNSKIVFDKKVGKIVFIWLISVVFIFVNFAPTFANSVLPLELHDENNPGAQGIDQEILEESPATNLQSATASEDPVNSSETLIDTHRLHFFSIAMPQLENRERNVIVYLPSDYQTGKNSYPVVYVLDAQSLFIQSSFSPEGRILNESLFQFYTRSFDREVIVVGMESDSIHLWDEYGPWVNQNMYLWMDPYEANQVEGGEGDAFLDFMEQTLKPTIDERYRTLTDREHTSIGGYKMGGLLSVYAGLTRSELYSHVVAMSPAVWFAESGQEWLSGNHLLIMIDRDGVPADVVFSLDVDANERITSLTERPAILDSQEIKIAFPQAYVEGTQALVNGLLRKGITASKIIGGIDNETEWTKSVTKETSAILAGENFFTYLPLIMKPPILITSASTATFTKSSASTFTITTSGYPVPTISISGTLPAGISFKDDGNGTARIYGTTNTLGTYTLTITAQNGVAPNATQTFTLEVIEGCPDSGSCLITFSIGMTPLNRTRNITVYLPPNYNSGASYPVIYLMDAQEMFGPPIAYPSSVNDWRMDEILDSYCDNTGKGIIAVAIWFDTHYPWSEYTITPNLNMDHWWSGESFEAPEGGGMINFIRYKLKPEIDSRFNTLSDRDHTAIGGGSRCALLALYAGLLAPETFSRVMAMSPAVWIAESKYEAHIPGLTTWGICYDRSGNYIPVCNGLEWWLAHNQAPTNVKYFLYIGTSEQSGYLEPFVQLSTNPGSKIGIEDAYVYGAQMVKSALTADGVQSIEYYEILGGTHHPSVWRNYIIPNVLPFFEW
jgi:predicted alpha/beta superfamily hydrolase